MGKEQNYTPVPTTLPKPAVRALDANGLDSLEAISKMSKKELLSYHGVGPKAIRLLKAAMMEHGLPFKE